MEYGRDPPEMNGHAAVRMENSIIVFGGCGIDEIWMYNLYTE